jgi:hypothetical protein
MNFDNRYALLPNFCSTEQCNEVIATLNVLPGNNDLYKWIYNPQNPIIEEFVKDVVTRFIALNYSEAKYFVDVLFNCLETGQSIPLHADWQGQGKQTINAIVYLSDPADYEGGSIEFPEINFSERPAQGTLVIYDATLQHQVTEITSGSRFTAPFAFTDDSTVKANPYNFTGE